MKNPKKKSFFFFFFFSQYLVAEAGEWRQGQAKKNKLVPMTNKLLVKWWWIPYILKKDLKHDSNCIGPIYD
jgi:hypothetical protein